MNKTIKDKEFLEIDPIQLLKVLWKRAWIIILAVVVCGGSMFCYTKFMVDPQYTAKAMLYVNNSSVSVGGTSFSLSDINASKSLVDTYIIILKSHKVLDDVSKELKTNYGYEYDYSSLRGMISAEAVDATEIFEVKVTSTKKEVARDIANTIVDILPKKIQGIMEGSSVQEVDRAVTPGAKSAPNVTSQTMLGMIIGFLLSAGAILLVELMDQYIRSEEYLLQTFSDIPVLAVIPDLDDQSSNKYNRYYGNKKRG